MFSAPAAATVRDRTWQAAVLVTLGVVGFTFFPLGEKSFTKWLQPDYSHGFLVPLFAAYLAWAWRAWAPQYVVWPDARGAVLLFAGAGLYVAARLTNFALEWVQGFAFVVTLLGVVLVYGGLGGLRWLAGPVLFLMFAFPLPYKVESALGWELQKVAAVGAEYTLQTIGYPTYREGNILHCQDHVLEVQNACNGLSMLLTFLTLATGMAMLVKRPWLDRGLILLSAIPIAVVANVIRIAATGVLYNAAGKELGDKVFHDLAGWVMMPLALGIMWVGLKVLDWVFLEDLGKATREEVIKNVTTNPALLFMPAFETAAANKAAGGKPASLPAPKPGGGRT